MGGSSSDEELDSASDEDEDDDDDEDSTGSFRLSGFGAAGDNFFGFLKVFFGSRSSSASLSDDEEDDDDEELDEEDADEDAPLAAEEDDEEDDDRDAELPRRFNFLVFFLIFFTALDPESELDELDEIDELELLDELLADLAGDALLTPATSSASDSDAEELLLEDSERAAGVAIGVGSRDSSNTELVRS